MLNPDLTAASSLAVSYTHLVGPASVGALGVNDPVHGLDDDFFQIGDGGNVHLLAEGVGLAQGVGGYGVVIACLVDTSRCV